MIRLKFCIVLIAYIWSYVATGTDDKFNSDPELDVPQIVPKNGYPIETHEVITEDGYILRMHRIPHGLNNSGEKTKPAVYLQHGLMAASADWVLMGPERGLGYLMADLGYDVWMGNVRGNRYSRKHTTKNPEDSEFWNFSWHEMGFYDLPAMIDTILNVTNQETLTYIGHSQGTTVSYVMGAMRPEYNSKVNLIISLAPVGYMHNIPNLIIREVGQVLTLLSGSIESREINPSSKNFQKLLDTLCNDKSAAQILCKAYFYFFYGYESTQLNDTLIPLILKEVSSGASTNQLIHYGQELISKRFQQYSFGFKVNFRIYGSLVPPDYNISKITAPVALYYGDNDQLVSPKDVQRLYDELPNGVLMRKVPYKGFTHIDFVCAADVKTILYDELLNFMKTFLSTN